jgi:hypothetical protein
VPETTSRRATGIWFIWFVRSEKKKRGQKKKMGQATFLLGFGGVLVYEVWMRGRAWLQSLLASLLSPRAVAGSALYD